MKCLHSLIVVILLTSMFIVNVADNVPHFILWLEYTPHCMITLLTGMVVFIRVHILYKVLLIHVHVLSTLYKVLW